MEQAESKADDDKLLLLPLADGWIATVEMGRIRPILAGLLELYAGGALEPASERIGL